MRPVSGVFKEARNIQEIVDGLGVGKNKVDDTENKRDQE